MKILKLPLLLLMLLLIPGCWGYQEVDESAFILALGVDKGEKNKLNLTAQIAVPKNIAGGGEGGGGGGGAKSTMVVSVETPTILAGLDLLGTFVERRPSLKHTKAIVFSSELAREGMGRYLAPLVRYRQFRRNTFMVVSRGKAEELVKNTQPILEDNPAKYIELLVGTSKYTGLFPVSSQVHQFYNAAKSEARQPVAILAALGGNKQKDQAGKKESVGEYLAGEIPREGGNKIDLMGTAVFNGGRMVGELTGNETTVMEMINGRFNQGIFSVPDPRVPEEYILLEARAERRPAVEISLEGQVPVINVEISLDAEFLSIQSNIAYERPGAINEVENAFAQILQRDADGLLRKTQEEFSADVFGFGEEARKKFLTWPEWEQYDWLKVFPQAEVNVNFNINIRRIGLLRESSPVKER
ncbi:MAG: Ger(x)C family spore germination protein [Firmicutes bacterium]|nr:Ger(x)C family spore germination protein [Bacillota bacterium]